MQREKPIRIILAEDEMLIAYDLETTLTELGYAVIEAVTTGEELVQKAIELFPDIILCDIILSGAIDGITAAFEIKKHLDIPIIYITGNADHPTVERARETQPFGYITKPISRTDLYSNIESAVYKHRMDTLLRESEEKYRSLIEDIDDIIYESDENGSITFCSAASTAITGYTPVELIGTRFGDYLHPDDKERAFKRIAEVQQDTRNIMEKAEQRIIAKSGKIVWIRTSSRPIIIDGQFRGLKGIISDITQEKQAEEKFKRAFEENPSPMAINNIMTGKYTEINHAFTQVLGYERQEVVGKTVRELSIFFAPGERNSLIEKIRNSGFIHNREMKVTAKNGEVKTGIFSASIIDIIGERHVLTCMLDITDQKKAEVARQKIEAQLQNAQRLESLGILAGGIAHDFNNILMAILGNVDLALHELPKTSPVRKRLIEVEKASNRAADLARQMLAYSGKGKFLIEAINLNELIKEMASMLQVSISKKAMLRFDLQEGLPFIEADSSQIRQVIMNLIINASESLENEGGTVSISTGIMECDLDYLKSSWIDEKIPAGRYVYVEVSDNGCGIDHDSLMRIFDPFFTTKFTGRGLGLAAVLGIVRGHKGTIRVYSEPGRGATFRVLLPVTGVVSTIEQEKTPGSSEWKGSGTVLLVDDEESILAVGTLMLENLGFQVLTASDGIQAVAILKENRDSIRCVLLDLTMQYMDGEEAFREMAQIDAAVPIILTSGYNEHEVIQRFKNKGPAGFIQKPYQLRTLRSVLQRIFSQ